MATWAPHVKFSFGGELGTPVIEAWSCSVRFKIGILLDDWAVPSTLPTPEALDSMLGQLNAPLQAWFNSPAAMISNSAKLTWAKLNVIKADGKQRDIATHRIDTGVVAGGAIATVPFYQTVALTLRTNKSRGRAHSGRVYPPIVVPQFDGGSPYIVKSGADGMAAHFASFLAAAANVIHDDPFWDALEGDVTPVVASPATAIGPDPGPALLIPVTGVVCDRVPDVQHRRTHQVPRLEGTRAAVGPAVD